MIKLNNKGFTLIELLAVLAIMVTIMAIAIPSISSSVERNRAKQDKAKQKIIISAAEVYLNDHVNDISTNDCYITISDLKTNGYLTDEEIKDSNGKDMTGIIKKSNDELKYSTSNTSGTKCINSTNNSSSTTNSENNQNYRAIKLYNSPKDTSYTTIYYKDNKFYKTKNEKDIINLKNVTRTKMNNYTGNKYTLMGYAVKTRSESHCCYNENENIKYLSNYSVNRSGNISSRTLKQKTIRLIEKYIENSNNEYSKRNYMTEYYTTLFTKNDREITYINRITNSSTTSNKKIVYTNYRFYMDNSNNIINSSILNSKNELYAIWLEKNTRE